MEAATKGSALTRKGFLHPQSRCDLPKTCPSLPTGDPWRRAPGFVSPAARAQRSSNSSAISESQVVASSGLQYTREFHELPTIVLSPEVACCPLEDLPLLATSSLSVQDLVKQLHEACLHVGFFYLVGHNVSQALVDDARNVTREFFQLPAEEKLRIALHESTHFRGYQPTGQNITLGRPDWHEAIDLYSEFSEDRVPDAMSEPLHGPNQWPDAPLRLRPVYRDYIAAMTGLGRRVMRLVALALGLRADTFEQGRAGDPFWIMRAIGYPPLPKDEGSLSCGEHTDYGLLTFVNQDPGITALQVQNRQGQWIDAPPLPGAFVVNLGNMLTIWTNGLYQSTLHRVINRSTQYRVSLPFFYEPNFEAVVEPLPECVSLSAELTGSPGVPVYEPVVYGEHLRRKVTSNFV